MLAKKRARSLLGKIKTPPNQETAEAEAYFSGAVLNDIYDIRRRDIMTLCQ